MATNIPYIPENITVHLGLPDSYAANVTVSFIDYVCNVASSEIYPTWEESALRANILAIISYALNRVYTEYYPSRGYNFNITASTVYDQKFINGRNFFDNIVEIANELFNDYIRRQGYIEPLSASYCNGTTVTCAGMSQWGSQGLAKDGFNSVQILKNYYGDNIELVINAPVQEIHISYPGTPLRLGDTGPNVGYFQVALNRVATAYPAIPTLYPVDSIFGSAMDQSVRTFQKIFSLTVDGIVGKATWYKAIMLYSGILKLNELESEGQQFIGISWEYPDAIQEGDSGVKVTHLQYMLSIIGEFTDFVSPVDITGYFNEETKIAVLNFQKFAHLPETGVVGPETWNVIYDYFAGMENTVLSPSDYYPPITSFPGQKLHRGMQD